MLRVPVRLTNLPAPLTWMTLSISAGKRLRMVTPMQFPPKVLTPIPDAVWRLTLNTMLALTPDVMMLAK